MKTYIVSDTFSCIITKKIQANSEEEALDKFYCGYDSEQGYELLKEQVPMYGTFLESPYIEDIVENEERK